MLDEYWEVEWVQYSPSRDYVLLGGYYRVVTAGGKTVSEFQNVHTSQTELSDLCPEGVSTWGDEEIATVVQEKTGVRCVFYEPPVESLPEPEPETVAPEPAPNEPEPETPVEP